jgi:hypothetical protein
MKNNRIIINNFTDIPDYEALVIVSKIIERGKISNDGKRYCYGARFTYSNNKGCVFCDENKQGYTFTIENDV